MGKEYRPNNNQVINTDDNTYRCWLEDNLVHKVNPSRLTSSWRSKLENIASLMDLPAFYDYIPGGYITKFIDGTDLHGNKPFNMDGSNLSCILPPEDRFPVLDIFNQAMTAGRVLGYTLGDITCGNIMVDQDNQLYLIDYDVIVPWPLSEAYIRIWNNTLRIVFGD